MSGKLISARKDVAYNNTQSDVNLSMARNYSYLYEGESNENRNKNSNQSSIVL
jgi:hypothetical protein